MQIKRVFFGDNLSWNFSRSERHTQATPEIYVTPVDALLVRPPSTKSPPKSPREIAGQSSTVSAL